MNQYARMGRIDGSRQRIRSLIAKVHVAKKELGLADDDYQAILIRITGHSSSAMLSEDKLVAVLVEFEAKGWKAKPRKKGTARAADTRLALKSRALWISLYQLGAIRNGSEEALEAFACRQLKCVKMQWADQSLGYRLVEALKSIGQRNGWDQSVEGVEPGARVLVLKRRLVALLFARLKDNGLVPVEWDEARAAFEFGGVRVPSFLLTQLTDLDMMAQVFGDKLRTPIGELSAAELAW